MPKAKIPAPTSARSPASAPAPAEAPADIPAALLEKLSPVVMEIYAAGDFHRADMRTVARESCTSFRTIYRYFSDKEQLLFWFINHWLKDLYPFAIEPLDGGGPMKERLLQVLVRHLEFYGRHPQVGRIIFMTVPLSRWMQDPSYAQKATMARLLQAIEQGQAQGELRQDVPALTILDALNAIFNRAFLMWEYRGRQGPLADQAEPLFKLLWGGVGTPARGRKP